METKGELDLEDLQQWQKDILLKNQRNALYESQQWQKDILEMEDSKVSSSIYVYGMERDKEIVLTQSQANMLEKVLGDDFYIQDEKVREVLKAVLELGFYYERDRKILNIARDCYLKGKNWIKRSYR